MKLIQKLKKKCGFINTNLWFIILFEFLLLCFIILSGEYFVGIVCIFALPVIIYCFISRERILLLLITYSSLLPTYSDYLRYPSLKIYISHEFISVLLFLLLMMMFFNSIFYDSKRQYFTITDQFILIYIFVVMFSLVRGLWISETSKYIMKEFFFMMLYIIYFIFKDIMKTTQQIKKYWKYFSLLSLVISICYILLSIAESGVGSILLTRVPTQHPHISLFAIPFLMSMILMRTSQKTKIIYLIMIFIILLMVFLSQQRALWIGLIISVILVYIFNLIKDEIRVKKILKLFGYVFIGICVLISIGLIIDKIFIKSSSLTFLSRFNTLLDLSSDESLRIRLAEISKAMDQWKFNPLFGTGLGSTINPITITHISNDNVDNSYVVILWKMGLIGLIVFLSIIGIILKHGFYVFKISNDYLEKSIIASQLAGICGLLFVALTNSCMIFYRYNIIWATSFATIEILYYKNKNYVNT